MSTTPTSGSLKTRMFPYRLHQVILLRHIDLLQGHTRYIQEVTECHLLHTHTHTLQNYSHTHTNGSEFTLIDAWRRLEGTCSTVRLVVPSWRRVPFKRVDLREYEDDRVSASTHFHFSSKSSLLFHKKKNRLCSWRRFSKWRGMSRLSSK